MSSQLQTQSSSSGPAGAHRLSQQADEGTVTSSHDDGDGGDGGDGDLGSLLYIDCLAAFH